MLVISNKLTLKFKKKINQYLTWIVFTCVRE